MSQRDKKEILKYLAPYLNIEKVFPLLPGIKKTSHLAQIIGISEAELKEIRQNLDYNAQKAALELLKLDEVVDALDKLPFKDGDVIVVAGDTVSDDYQGWVEILRHTIEIGTELELEWHNSAVHGYSSYDLLKHLDNHVMAHHPNWVFIAVGLFDAYRPNYASNRPMVSVTEFWENLNSISDAIETHTQNPIIWISPTSIIEEMIEDDPLTNGRVLNSDLHQYQEIISGKKGYVVDAYGKRFGNPTQAWHYLNDGLHHSISGHMETVKSVLSLLAVDKDSNRATTK